MSKPHTIQINIPTPCSQSWEEMSLSGDGRFCAHCQKTVIDFTTYSDTALYNFFAKNDSHVCGRFLGTQLDRNIHIPPQPHSQLYRLTVAFGLTLLFTQTPQLLAQNRPPKTSQSILKGQKSATLSGVIETAIKESGNRSCRNTKVQLFQNGILEHETLADNNGHYHFPNLSAGIYDLSFEHSGFRKTTLTHIIIKRNQITQQNIKLFSNRNNITSPIVETQEEYQRANQVVVTGTPVQIRKNPKNSRSERNNPIETHDNDSTRKPIPAKKINN